MVGESQQIIWSEVIDFLVSRFKKYERQKSSVGQWEQDGIDLKDLALGRNPEKEIRERFSLPAVP